MAAIRCVVVCRRAPTHGLLAHCCFRSGVAVINLACATEAVPLRQRHSSRPASRRAVRCVRAAVGPRWILRSGGARNSVIPRRAGDRDKPVASESARDPRPSTSWSRCTAGPPPCASTTDRNSPLRASSIGARRTAWQFIKSSRASRIKTRTSNASTAATAPRCSMRTSSNRSPSSTHSLPLGYGSTTASGPTTASAGCRRSRFCRGLHQPASLFWQCLLDGELTPLERDGLSTRTVCSTIPICAD
jgi:hypothetical protein